MLCIVSTTLLDATVHNFIDMYKEYDSDKCNICVKNHCEGGLRRRDPILFSTGVDDDDDEYAAAAASSRLLF